MVAAALAQVVSGGGTRVVDGLRDPDELVDVVTRLTRPHRIIPVEPAGGVHATADALVSGGLSFTRLRYGAAVTVIPGEVDPDTFLFVLSMGGSARLTYGSRRVDVDATAATVIAPYREFRSEIDATYEQVIVGIERTRIEAAMGRLTGGTTTTLDLEAATFVPNESMLRTLEAVATLQTGALAAEAQFAERLADVAVESVLLSTPAVRALLPERRDVSSPRVRRAMEFMRAHLADPLTIAEIAESVQVSPRALQAAFRAEVDMSPTQWLREQRLAHAWRLLTGGAASATVADVATASGFGHLGEFAAHFRARFGVLPSAARQQHGLHPASAGAHDFDLPRNP